MTFPLLFSDFYIIQFGFHISGKLHIDNIWKNSTINEFTISPQFGWFKRLETNFLHSSVLNSFNRWCIS